jgi:hypothetical protein
MKNRVARLAITCVALTFSPLACGSPSSITTGAPGRPKPTADDLMKVRPGDSLDRYLGIYVPAATQAKIDNTAREAARNCAKESAPFQPPSHSVRSQLRMTDRAGHRAAYGYGISAEAADLAESALSQTLGTAASTEPGASPIPLSTSGRSSAERTHICPDDKGRRVLEVLHGQGRLSHR